MSHADTFRARSSIRGWAEEVEAGSANADAITIEDLEVTQEIDPGGQVALSFLIFQDANAVSSLFDPDYCIARNLADGVKLRLEVLLNGSVVQTRDVCWPEVNRDRRAVFDFPGPTNVGTFDLEVVARRRSDMQVVDSAQSTFTVTEDPVDGVCPEGFVRDPATGTCVPVDGGGGGGGDTGLFEQARTILLLVAVITVAIAFTSGAT